MKNTLLLATSLFALSSTASELAYAPEEGLVITRTFVSNGEYELSEVAVEVDGNEMEQEAPDMSISSSETITVTDKLEAVDDGRVMKLSRTFDELAREVEFGFGGETRPEVSISDFEGVTVVFEYDEESGDVEVSAEEDADISQEYLDTLFEDMDFRSVLPEDDVDEGDSWDLDPESYLAIMSPAGVLNFYTEEAGEVDESSRAADLDMLASIDGEATAELVEIRKDDDGMLAVIRLEFDVASEATVEFEIEGGAEGTRTMSVERTAEGELLWDLERGILRSGRFEADATLTITMEFSPEDEEGTVHEIMNSQVFDGTIEYEIDFEVE